jgi:hypothetical protein
MNLCRNKLECFHYEYLPLFSNISRKAGDYPNGDTYETPLKG